MYGLPCNTDSILVQLLLDDQYENHQDYLFDCFLNLLVATTTKLCVCSSICNRYVDNYIKILDIVKKNIGVERIVV